MKASAAADRTSVAMTSFGAPVTASSSAAPASVALAPLAPTPSSSLYTDAIVNSTLAPVTMGALGFPFSGQLPGFPATIPGTWAPISGISDPSQAVFNPAAYGFGSSPAPPLGSMYVAGASSSSSVTPTSPAPL